MKKNRNLFIMCFSGIVIISILCLSIVFSSVLKNNNAEKQKKIAALYMTLNNPYFEVINKEVAAKVHENGDKIITRDAALDVEMQIREIEDMIKEDVDLILLNAVDWKKILPGLEKAKKAGIPVLAVDTQVYDSDYVEGMIASNNHEAGVLVAKNLMSLRDGGEILLLVQSNNISAQDRIEGFLATLDEAGWPYHIVDTLECSGQLEIAQPLVEKVLNRTKDIDVVMALNDPSALGAMAALEAEGMLSDVLVYGVDGAPEAKTMIYEGKMTATVAQSPMLTGRVAGDAIYEILHGKEIKKQINMSVHLINQDNIGNYSLSSWE